MKTSKFLKSGIFAAAFSLFAVGVNAQSPLPTTPNPVTPAYYTLFAKNTPESIDTVTVGSRMAYKTEGDPIIAGMISAGRMVASDFKWAFTPNTIPVYAPGANGTATSPAAPSLGGHVGYSKDLKEIHTIMPATAQTVTLNVNEWSMLTTTKEGCVGQDTTYTIVVVNRPTIKWAETTPEQSFCAAAGQVIIPLTLTGYSQWEVTYSIKYFTNFDKSDAGSAGANTKITVPANKSLSFAASNFSNAGAYEITISDITDRISRKSLDMNLVKAQTADLPTTAYTIFVLPAPKTQKLQHVRNMP